MPSVQKHVSQFVIFLHISLAWEETATRRTKTIEEGTPRHMISFVKTSAIRNLKKTLLSICYNVMVANLIVFSAYWGTNVLQCLIQTLMLGKVAYHFLIILHVHKIWGIPYISQLFAFHGC